MRAQQTKFMASIESIIDDGSQLGHEGDLEAEHDSEESKQVVCSLCHDHNSRLPISFLILLQVYDGSTAYLLLARSFIGSIYLRWTFLDFIYTYFIPRSNSCIFFYVLEI